MPASKGDTYNARGGHGGERGSSRGRGRGRGRGGGRGGRGRGGRGRGNNRGGSHYYENTRDNVQQFRPEESEEPDWREVLRSVVPVMSMMDEARRTGMGSARPARVNWRVSSIKFVSAGMLETSLKIKDIKPFTPVQIPRAPEIATNQPPVVSPLTNAEITTETPVPVSPIKEEPSQPSVTTIPSLANPISSTEVDHVSTRRRSASNESASSGDEILFGGRTNGANTPLQTQSKSPVRKYVKPATIDHSLAYPVCHTQPKSARDRKKSKSKRHQRDISPSLLDPGLSNLSLEPRLYRRSAYDDESANSEEDPAIADYIENLRAQENDSSDEVEAVSKQAESLQLNETSHAVASGPIDFTTTTSKLQTNIIEDDNESDDEPKNFDDNDDDDDYDSSNDSVGTIEQAANDLQDAFDHADKDGALYKITAERMTDEQIAKRLAKQEELGLGSTNLVLLGGNDDFQMDDDLELGDLELKARNYSNMASRRDKSRSKLSAKSAFVDSLADGVPYADFDVTDRERSSIRKGGKSKNKKPQLWLSDSELEREIIESWEKDKSAKRQRRVEREQRRAEGLLGRNGKVDKAVKYKDGFTFEHLREEVCEFLESEKPEHSLPPMHKRQRMIVHELSRNFNIKTMSRGSGDSRFTTLLRTRTTIEWSPTMWIRLEPRFEKRFSGRSNQPGGFGKRTGGGGGGGGFKAASYREGEVVGAAAPELGAENIGRAMLERMGWSEGTALGALTNKGILQPVTHVVKNSKIGLG